MGRKDAEEQRGSKSLREILSFSKKEKKDPLLDYLLGFKDRMAHAKGLLTDDALTAFFFVTLPESLPIAVITRFINWFHEFGILSAAWWSMESFKRPGRKGFSRVCPQPDPDAG